MIGVIAGDVIGSVHEHALTKRTDFALFDPRCRFTDDTVLTVATAYAILNGTPYATAYRDFDESTPMRAVTHNHLEGIKGAQATALAVFMARADASKDQIREEIMQRFGPSGSPCRSAVMPIPKPQSRAALLRRSIDGSLTRSSLASESGCLHDSTK
jgi:ADP-ribosylglycohydrolase